MWLLVEEKKIQNNNWKKLFIQMDIWAQRLYYQSARSLQIYFTLSLLLSLLCLYPLSPVFFSLSALLYQSHCFYCALKHSHKFTCWILSWDIKLQGSRIQRKLFYILSLWKLFMFITRCTRWISSQTTNVPLLKSDTKLQEKTFPSCVKTDEDNWGFWL